MGILLPNLVILIYLLKNRLHALQSNVFMSFEQRNSSLFGLQPLMLLKSKYVQQDERAERTKVINPLYPMKEYPGSDLHTYIPKCFSRLPQNKCLNQWPCKPDQVECLVEILTEPNPATPRIFTRVRKGNNLLPLTHLCSIRYLMLTSVEVINRILIDDRLCNSLLLTLVSIQVHWILHWKWRTLFVTMCSSSKWLFFLNISHLIPSEGYCRVTVRS